MLLLYSLLPTVQLRCKSSSSAIIIIIIIIIITIKSFTLVVLRPTQPSIPQG